MMSPLKLPLLAALGAAALVGGCGRTLVFAESDGVNFAIRTNPSSDTPVEVNFGLNRTVGTIVPPAGQKGDKPKGEAVNMLAGFEVDNNYVTKQIGVDLTVDTQFASGAAAKEVAKTPEVAAQIVNMGPVTISMMDSAKQLRAWLRPSGKFSAKRSTKLQEWLDNRYKNKNRQVLNYDLINYDDFEEDRVAALRELKDVPAN